VTYAAAQAITVRALGGRGLQGSVYLESGGSTRDALQAWIENSGGKAGTDEHGRFYVWALDRYADTSAWPHLTHRHHVFADPPHRTRALDELANAYTGGCDWDPEGQAFRVDDLQAVSTPAIDRNHGFRRDSKHLDLRLLEDYWQGRKYHHTLSTSLIYALREALLMAEEEGLEARYARHERHHLALAAGIEAMGLSLLPPVNERLWTLNTVRVPPGVDEAAVRRTLLQTFNLEVGAGLGPLAGKIWRVGLMGASSTPQTLLQFLAALEASLATQGHRLPGGAGVAAAETALRSQLTAV